MQSAQIWKNTTSRRKTSNIWHFFDASEDKTRAICKTCFKPIASYGTSTMKKHLKLMHPYQHSKFEMLENAETKFRFVEQNQIQNWSF